MDKLELQGYLNRIENEFNELDRHIRFVKTDFDSKYYQKCVIYDIEDLEVSLRAFRDRLTESIPTGSISDGYQNS